MGGSADTQRLWGWIVAVVGLAAIMLYVVMPEPRHHIIVAAGWAFLAYGGMSVRIAALVQRVAVLEAKGRTTEAIGAPLPKRTTNDG